MNIIPLGIALVFIGLLIIMIGMLMQAFSGQEEPKAKFSFVGFIGPFPFGFGNDGQWVMTSLVMAIIFSFLMIWLFKGAR